MKEAFFSSEREKGLGFRRGQARRSMDRRRFLMELGGGFGLMIAAPGFGGTEAGFPWPQEPTGSSGLVDPAKQDRVLVVLQMTGGNDGLNTVVPYEDDVYARSRPTLRLRRSQVHRLAEGLGLHPEMQEAARLFHQGRLSILQGVGYPNSQRNHPEAMRDWQTGRVPGVHVPTGWLGRAADLLAAANPLSVPAVFVGRIAIPFTLRGKTVPAFSLSEYPQLPELLPSIASPRLGRWMGKAKHPWADWLAQTYRQAFQLAERLRHAPDSLGQISYPSFGLAKDLQVVARLIRAQVGIRIFCVELGGGGLGGFDTHAHQAANHGALLREFSASVAAWAEDLAQDGTLDRVLLMTFSEFGRTVRENGRRGTDHGAAQPVFLVGGRIRPGLIGPHPNLADLQANAPKPHTDFRRLYRTVLQEWLGLEAKAVLGEQWPPLPLLL